MKKRKLKNVKKHGKIKGAGFFDWVKGAANTINNGLKKSKIISNLAPLIPIPGAAQIGKVASNLGYGKPRRSKFKK